MFRRLNIKEIKLRFMALVLEYVKDEVKDKQFVFTNNPFISDCSILISKIKDKLKEVKNE